MALKAFYVILLSLCNGPNLKRSDMMVAACGKATQKRYEEISFDVKRFEIDL